MGPNFLVFLIENGPIWDRMKIDRQGVAAGRWQKGFSSHIDLDRLGPKHFTDFWCVGLVKILRQNSLRQERHGQVECGLGHEIG